ncbi:flavin-dependent oxidoreductase [Roseateles terrae]|uniref:2-polyprenyl-6-methoxyphenol hydroxylase-like FAD-dependent oxidoreductase n=1 Tax=Roseateles terrae TaxID=431060 RepID=A0ABR6GRK6_9BURK|nr:flavin-dependent oxidoreductase [Roseateles terrae]MBB3194709.1 2-polyprenyl-6-methoxyphenol hydroxylase-like FAD-dependent oxidoreductase [Roseateles terrae]OWQ86010.1 flavin-dependent oxidoreductase [Roseateles terrae]
MDILIAGGGIGGLTAALALHQDGHRVQVCEAASQLKPLGVGINLLPHAVAVLDRLGLMPQLEAMAVPTSALVFANRHGQPLYRDTRGVAGGYSHPQFSIHRGEFQMLLWRTAQERLGAEALCGGERVVGVRQQTAGEGPAENRGPAIAEIEHSDGRRSERRAALVIGADGIHSALRRQFHPDEGPPRWNGMMMWRGTTLARPFLDGRTMVQAGHRRAKFVVYPIAPPRPDGLQLINWICDRRLREDGLGGGLSAPGREDWSKPGQISDLLPTFGAWHFDWLDVPGVIEGAQQLLEWPMVDRDPLPRWRQGRVTLLGDAAHPMYPIGSNGATQAIMDAQALARALRDHGLAGTGAAFADAADVPARGPADAHAVTQADAQADAASEAERLEVALAAYEDERRPLCARIVEMNRQEGLDYILDMVEERAPDGFERLEDVIDPAEIDAFVRGYKAAAGHRLQQGQGSDATEGAPQNARQSTPLTAPASPSAGRDASDGHQ